MQITDKFEIVPVAEIKPDERNARKHSDEQIMELRRSLREFGFVNPLLIDKDKKIIAGHGRLVAAIAEGITAVPCIFVEHLTEAQRRAWYTKNSAGRVWQHYLECTDSAMAERAAQYMEQICANDAYGYTQDKVHRWDGYRTIVANRRLVEGAYGDFDCSSLIISCYILAGLNLEQDGYTGNLRARLMATGKFKSYSNSAHLSTDKLAKRGGIYLRNGHALMALESGCGSSGTSEAGDLKVVGKIIVDEINKWCNVRCGPGLEYTIIGRAKKNDNYSIYGVVEDWYQIDYNGSIGYIYGDLASEVLPGNV